MYDYDAIVIGARVAGSPTAMLLARRGYRVLLLDRATFPHDTISTQLIQTPGVAHLTRWGLLERLVQTGCPPIHRFDFDFGPFSISGPSGALDGGSPSYAPRRSILDHLLVTAAAEAGAEVREGFAVRELLWDDGQVVGVVGQDATGRTWTERARIVIGADGRHSLVAQAVEAPLYEVRPPLSFAYYSYWSGVDAESTMRAYLRPGRAIIALPTHADQVLIGVQWPHAEFEAFRENVEGNFLDTLELAPALAERVRGGRRESRFLGTADLPNFFRRPFGPGWALVGDAGYHRDPALGHGISDAFRDAELLAEAVDLGLQARLPLAHALRCYQQRRDEQARPLYELITQLATLAPPPPELSALLAAMAGRQPEMDRFIAMTAGELPVKEVLGPATAAA
jgi:flavin-dependent dehydrogenase